jgi:lactate racemase
MVDCWLPYGETEVYVSVEMESLLGIADIRDIEPENTGIEIILNALMDPYGKPLEELVEPGVDVVIAVDIYSSPQAVTQALTQIIKMLVELIVPKERITIILGNGENEKEEKIIREAIRDSSELRGITLHDHNRNTDNITFLGETHHGTPVEINRRYHESKIKIALGETRINPLKGYSGAHNAIVPGLATINTIREYRKLYFDSDISSGSIELNAIKEDVLEAVSKTGIDFAVNLVTNKKGKIIAAHAGGYEESWGKAINSLADQPEISSDGDADIVVISAGGFPYDKSFYKAIWSLHNGVKASKRNGTIILLAQCVEGLGGEAFTHLSRVSESSELKRRYMYGADALDLLRKVQKNNRIILVSALPNYLVEALDMDSARTANDAYKKAVQSRRGRKTIVIPHGYQSTLI